MRNLYNNNYRGRLRADQQEQDALSEDVTQTVQHRGCTGRCGAGGRFTLFTQLRDRKSSPERVGKSFWEEPKQVLLPRGGAAGEDSTPSS